MHSLPTLMLLLAVVMAPGLAAAQSFNCNRARYPDEKRICAEPVLSRLDEQLAAAYGAAIRRLGPSRARQLDNEEDAWVVERRRCGADYGCIERNYLERIAELSAMGSSPRPAVQPRLERPAAAEPPPAPTPAPAPPPSNTAPRRAGPAWINPAPAQ
jgi:uncharacterized protein